MVLTQFARPYNFCSFLSLPATPCKFFVLNPRKRVHFLRKSGGFELVLDKKMCSLKFVELIRNGKEEHSVCCCCCGDGSQSEGDLKLEADILAFMEKSQNPDAFPSRKDLEKAGRVDLIEAIRNRGGWYSFGWDSEEEPPTDQENVPQAEEMDFDIEELRRRVEKYQESDSGSDFSSGDSSQPASSSGRSLEAVVEEDSVIEGILNRLEKERISSLGINTSKYGYGANHSSRDNIDDRSSGTTTTGRAPYRTDLGKNGSLTSPKKGGLSDSGGQLNHKYTPDMWRSWSTQRACPEGTEFEVGEVDFDKRPNGGKTETSRDDVFIVKKNSSETPERWIYNNHNDISTRLQHLELELSSTLRSMRSKSQEFSSMEHGDLTSCICCCNAILPPKQLMPVASVKYVFKSAQFLFYLKIFSYRTSQNTGNSLLSGI